jgi:hypothetical protein
VIGHRCADNAGADDDQVPTHRWVAQHVHDRSVRSGFARAAWWVDAR